MIAEPAKIGGDSHAPFDLTAPPSPRLVQNPAAIFPCQSRDPMTSSARSQAALAACLWLCLLRSTQVCFVMVRQERKMNNCYPQHTDTQIVDYDTGSRLLLVDIAG